MKVLKFGGTSVGAPQRMHEVARLITREAEPKIVVLSAVSGTTNTLVQISEHLRAGKQQAAAEAIDNLYTKYLAFVPELLNTNEAREQAQQVVDEHFSFLKGLESSAFTAAKEREVLAQGELLSTKLFYEYLKEIKVEAALLPALDFMVIDDHKEPVLDKIRENLKEMLAKHQGQKIYVTQGFICRNASGEVDNLRRGGSDYSASLIGGVLEAEEVQIWTDISGMHNNDPRIIKNTYPIARLSFDEAAELAYFGAKILHPSSILPAQRFNVPVRLLNTMEPEAQGTLIGQETDSSGVRAVAAKDGITAIKIKSSRMLMAYGFLRTVFEIFERYRTPIDMITTSEVAVSVTIDDDTNLEQILNELKEFGQVEVDTNQAIVCLVGYQLVEQRGIVTNALESLHHIPLRMISYGGSRHNVSILIDEKFKVEALTSLNEKLFS
jgi:aspartate kinase